MRCGTPEDELVGRTFGRLAVSEIVRSGRRRLAVCRCTCGTEKRVDVYNLRSGNTVSCGCFRAEAMHDAARRRPRIWTIEGAIAWFDSKHGRVTIDAEDLPKVLDRQWTAAGNGCVLSQQNGPVYLHRIILGLSTGDGMEVDHRNHNRRDNRKENLRLADRVQQAGNMRKYGICTSKFKGVCWSDGVWRADIQANGQRRPLGRFASEVDAALVYDQAAREIFGDFACVNFPAMHTNETQA